MFLLRRKIQIKLLKYAHAYLTMHFLQEQFKRV